MNKPRLCFLCCLILLGLPFATTPAQQAPAKAVIAVATSPAAGAHEYKVLGRNSRGTGPESDVSTVNVA